MLKPIITVLAALAATAAMGAHAETVAAPSGETTVAVTYSDLDLTRPAGTEVLQSRIDKAADKVCAKPDIRELKATQEFEACQAKARDAAMEQPSLANPFEGIALASAF